LSYTRTSSSFETFSGFHRIGDNSWAQIQLNAVPFPSTRTGEKVQDYEKKIASGDSASSNYGIDSSKVSKRIPGGFSMTAVNPNNGFVYKEAFNGFSMTVVPPSHLSVSTVGAENDALMKLIKKIKSEREHLNGLAFAGELREAIHGIRHPFQLMREQVYSHLNTLGKRKRALLKYPEPTRKKAWREIVSGTWLETSFGLRPIISDARSIAEAIARAQFDPVTRTRLQTRGQTLVSAVQTTQAYSGGYIPSAKKRVDRITSTKAFCQWSVGMEMKQSANFGAATRLIDVLGFTPENFVPALYQVMPWSWLIDYFSNIGDIVDAACVSTTGVTWKSKSVGLRTNVRYIARVIQPAVTLAADGMVVKSFTGGSLGQVILDRATYSRDKNPTIGLPTLQLSLPVRGVQWANLTAILAQFSGKAFDPNWARLVDPTPNATAARNRRRGVNAAESFLN